MNILFSVPRLHTNYSGMIRGLQDDGHCVSVISLEGGNVKVPEGIDISWHPLSAKKRFFIPRKRSKQLHFPPFQKIKQIIDKEKPDVVIARDVIGLNVILSLVCYLKGIRIIFYDQRPAQVESLNHLIWLTISSLFISRYRITTVKQGKGKFKFKNTFFIPFPAPNHIYDGKYHTKVINSVKSIISVGKFDEERKNLIYLIEEVSDYLKNHNAKLNIYGALRIKDSPVYKKIIKFINENELNEFISIHINKNYRTIKEAYHHSDLYILPSYNEPAAISHIEAMYCGVPVIVTSDNGTNYVIKPGENGFIINPKLRGDIKSKLDYLHNNPALLDKLSSTASQTIQDSYLPEHFSKNLMAILKNIGD